MTRPRPRRWHALAAGLAGVLLGGALAAGAAGAAEAGAAAPASPRFFDPQDGWLDVSGFLDTAYGFVPVVAPITEPAVGYGAAGALLFIDRDATGKGRPNIAVLGGLRTDNGTQGLFAAHLGTWMDNRLRTLVGVVDADVNLDFFGLGGDRLPAGSELGYSVAARGGTAGASYRIGATPLWVGLQYGLANTSVQMTRSPVPGFAPDDRALRLAALVPSITFDARDNFFTPTEGWYVDLSVPLFRKALGGDRDFERPVLTAMGFTPLAPSTYLSARGALRSSSEGTPFYLRPFVLLRGVQAMKYQGEQAAEAELELRWQFHPRLSAVAFAGAGAARTELVPGRERGQTVSAGGLGFRYLLARAYGLHLGLDVGFGPDQPIYYVVFGSAWARP